MLSAFKYRLYPKDEQEMRLKRSLLMLCSLYNRLRAKKIEEYKQHGISLTLTTSEHSRWRSGEKTRNSSRYTVRWYRT